MSKTGITAVDQVAYIDAMLLLEEIIERIDISPGFRIKANLLLEKLISSENQQDFVKEAFFLTDDINDFLKLKQMARTSQVLAYIYISIEGELFLQKPFVITKFENKEHHEEIVYNHYEVKADGLEPNLLNFGINLSYQQDSCTWIKIGYDTKVACIAKKEIGPRSGLDSYGIRFEIPREYLFSNVLYKGAWGISRDNKISDYRLFLFPIDYYEKGARYSGTYEFDRIYLPE